MRLAIVHYHLRRGGVTKVIASALEALGAGFGDAVVLSSCETEEPLPCKVVVIPELAYTETASREAATALYRAMVDRASTALGGPPDLWHIHNHCLGKNVNFPESMRLLLGDGARLLLQIHDFAEDGRPANYSAQRQPYDEGVFDSLDRALYPVAPQVGYAVLNGRDRDILSKAGIPEKQLFWLANAVTTPPLLEAEPKPGGGKPLILYPTRAIRRKNLGELLLMALAFPDYRFATTLSPKNPQWAGFYEGWVNLASELRLPVDFALGERPGNTFEGLIKEASAMVTTSVGEGFGLAFLEPWLFGKPVCGRDLPEVTEDFRSNGIALPDLYPEWPLPLTVFNMAAFRQRLFGRIRDVYTTYGKTLANSKLSSAWERVCSDGSIDFGLLDETAQAEALRSLSGNLAADLPIPPFSIDKLDRSIIASNAGKISSAYGLESYGTKLREIYNCILQATPAEPEGLDSTGILEAFLDLNRFRLLRS